MYVNKKYFVLGFSERNQRMTKQRKRQLIVDLALITVITFVVLAIIVLIGDRMNDFTYDQSINIVIRVAVIGICGQFGIAGLGISIACLIRKEKFTGFGLTVKNLIPAILLSSACCVPDFLYNLYRGDAQAWCPFREVNMTAEVLTSPFPYNILAYLITAVCWGFFEGFNYVVIRDKICELFPSKYRFLDWGALICALMCLAIHGAIGVNLYMVVTFILIYGMLIVRKETGNAWGCVLIFMAYWNAL